ncbi:MAG: SRPBCC family protein [Bacteroidota bacterium]
MKILNRISNFDDGKRKYFSIFISVAIAILLTLLGIYVIEDYGIALFILVPFFLGFSPVIIYGYNNDFSRSKAHELGFLSFGIFLACLIAFAIEGLICIVMALPIGLAFTWIGILTGYFLINNNPTKGPPTLIIFIFLIPTFSFVESGFEPKLYTVVTSIEINASPEEVWKNVVEFPELKEPTEFIFKTGIAYPINAKIKGKGVGAIRYCNFTTGSFVEPITKWDEPNLLAFDVLKQPLPMKEMSFWDIDAPHLHDYFVSKRGQFKIVNLGNGKVKLIGTTWYYNDIKPNFYWNIWSENIIHKIHNRVLNHIKINSEK